MSEVPALPAAAATDVPGGPEPLVRSRAVRRSFRLGSRAVEVLRGITLSVDRGEMVAITGASGAGKSTLLHLLGGLDAPDEGEVWLDGLNLTSLSQTELVRLRNRRVGLVFQAYHLLPELDALENVCLPARIARVPIRQAVARGRELLEAVGLGDRTEHRPAELSGGEQQRVAIARALVNQPDLVLADEPTGNLDSHTGEEIMQLLDRLRRERQATLIIATHDSRVASLAARIIRLADGVIATAP